MVVLMVVVHRFGVLMVVVHRFGVLMVVVHRLGVLMVVLMVVVVVLGIDKIVELDVENCSCALDGLHGDVEPLVAGNDCHGTSVEPRDWPVVDGVELYAWH